MQTTDSDRTSVCEQLPTGPIDAEVSKLPASSEVLGQALRWLDEGRQVAIVTVIKTWGSAPRAVGSQLVVNDQMNFVGSVSSGCVEVAAIRAAMNAMRDGRVERIAFGVSDANAFSVGLPCGGEIELLIEPHFGQKGQLERLCEAVTDKRPAVMITNLISRERYLTTSLDGGAVDLSHLPIPRRIADEAHLLAECDKSGLVSDGESEWFIDVKNPPLRLFIIGAVHVAQSLALMATINEFDTVIVDPRTAFASETRFPNSVLCHEWPEMALRRACLDRRTAIVTLAHDPKLDDPALLFAVRSPAFYVGALGSHRSHQSRLERLQKSGLQPHELQRIHGPVGLRIGARTTAEIATSIMAEVIHDYRMSVVS